MKGPASALILLAAGASTRLGQPKQLLNVNGSPLLQWTLDRLNRLTFNLKLLVLGAKADDILAKINPEPFVVTVNSNWQEGIGSSIRCGMERLMQLQPEVQELMMVLADQPLISEAYLNRLQQQHRQSGKGITASRYGHSIGVPALFSPRYFPALSQGKGDQGAKKLMMEFAGDTEALDCPEAEWDIDTPQDYQRFLERLNPKI